MASGLHAKLAAMAFTVLFSGQPQPRDFGDDDGFEFLEGGVLAIHFDDEDKRAEYYPSSKWDQVMADSDHLAGLNTPYVDEDDEDDEDYEDEDEEGDFDDDDYGDEDYDSEDHEADDR
ncbi:hypothetical protein DVS77_14140 [Mycolicibacterium moriokaense]|nr:hypothetical protein DVS77_14140 [Mycolicibacterium moriokaense]